VYEDQGAEDPENQTPGERGGSVPLNWACTDGGYRVEGRLPERCPGYGAGREESDEVPVPGF
jgi:rubrerythrin